MKTKLKKEFKDKLDELGVYEMWKINVINNLIYGSGCDDFISELNEIDNFRSFIGASFLWDNSNEGYDFWAKIAGV